MNSDDDTFFEDAEEDTNFPDEDIAEDEEEDIEEVLDIEEDVQVEYETDSGFGLAKFLQDPWPSTVFLLTVIGIGILLLVPPEIWNPNRYGILGAYFLTIASVVGIVFSLITWSRAGTHRLRWAGPANIIVILACLVIGILDSIMWMISGMSLVPALDSPLIVLCFMLVIFSLYTLWMIQKSLDPEHH